MKHIIKQEAQVEAGAVFIFNGRPLKVVSTHGRDEAAPVIVEEMTDIDTLKGQLCLWAADGVKRAMFV